MGFFKPVDYRGWAPEQDLVSNDHYLIAEDPDNAQQLAMTADLLRSLAGGRPWMLMEHSTSAVNWQPRNLAKSPGELVRNSLQHVARGADGVLFFQWRQSAAGAEKFHSALVPHAGTDSRVWRDVCGLGADLQAMAEIVGSTTEQAQVGIVFDWPSWWAAELDSHPSADVDPLAEARRWHALCWRHNIGVDLIGLGDDFSAYRLLVLPCQYLMTDAAAVRLADFAQSGGTVLVTYFSGIVDADDHVRLGGYPGLLSDLLGVRIEEFAPLGVDVKVPLSAFGTGQLWSEHGRSSGADVISNYTDGPVAGSPAITRHAVGAGSAWYVGTQLASLDDLGARVFREAGVVPTLDGLPAGVEAVRRVGPTASYVFLINHTDGPSTAVLSGTDVLTGAVLLEAVVPAGGVRVIRQPLNP